MTNNKIVDLAMDFSISVVNLCDTIKGKSAIVNQFLRSGTSIGANVKEAVCGQTPADFYAKMNISLKETSETEYWLELLHESDYIDQKSFESIYADCKELIRILTSITKTQKQ